MKICIPFKPSDVGGPSIFMRKFTEGMMKKESIEVGTAIDGDYEPLFVVIPYNLFFNKKLHEKESSSVKIVPQFGLSPYFCDECQDTGRSI